MSIAQQLPPRARAGLALLAALSGAPAWSQGHPVYTVSPLPGLSSVTAFNDGGLILGRGFVPCSGLCALSDVAVLYDTRSGTLTPLGGGFGGAGTQFGAINARGQLAGSTSTYDGLTGTWVRSVVVRQVDGTLTPLATPALSASQISGLRARGFNNAGQVLLQHSDGMDAQAPFCGNYQGWIGTGTTAASWQPLGPAGMVVHPTGLNAAGVGVGSAAPSATCGAAGGGFRAVAALPTGALVDLHGSLPGRFSHAHAINDLGYAVGDHDTGATTAQGTPIVHAVVWNTATRSWYSLGLAGSTSRLNAVNNRGEVVGTASGRAALGNLATNGPLVDLNALLANNSAGWVLQEAVAINASGQIVARGASATGGSGHVLLTPVSAPYDPYAVLPSAPASLATSGLTASSVALTWTNTARNATRLVVERCKGSYCNNFVALATLPGDTARYADTTLTRRTAYRWRVRAGNATGLSAPSNVVAGTTLR